MITGLHAIAFSPEAEKVRAFFADVLGMPSVDAGGGWLIFAMPPAELAVHPADGQTRYVYPLWQVRDGATLPGLEAVLRERLDGKTPLDVLRAGDIAAARAAARMYGTHGAI